jgi:hypothetical protein
VCWLVLPSWILGFSFYVSYKSAQSSNYCEKLTYQGALYNAKNVVLPLGICTLLEVFLVICALLLYLYKEKFFDFDNLGCLILVMSVASCIVICSTYAYLSLSEIHDCFLKEPHLYGWIVAANIWVPFLILCVLGMKFQERAYAWSVT